MRCAIAKNRYFETKRGVTLPIMPLSPVHLCYSKVGMDYFNITFWWFWI